MLIYNKTIFSFIKALERHLKDIIQNETNLELGRTRFLKANHYYPIDIVIFQGESKIAYFDHETYQIGVNEALIHEARTHVLKDILRHEFAHYLTYIDHGFTQKAHGQEFIQTCKSLNWDKSISKASMNLETFKTSKVGNLENEKVLSKVKKLLKLADSNNENESQLATLKANQLLMQHNLKYVDSIDEEDFFIYTFEKHKRRNSKLMAIYDILKFFYVSPILRYKKSGVSLEVCGTKLNIELAKYVYEFLNRELESQWNQFKKNNPQIKGLKAKKSFFMGLSKGYENKMLQNKQELFLEHEKELVVYEKKMEQVVSKIYKRLSTTTSSKGVDQSALNAGHNAGKKLNINKAIKNTSTKTKLLGFFS